MSSTYSTAQPAWVGDVLHFWFEELGDARWFSGSAHTDAQIRERFLSLHEELVAVEAADCIQQQPLLAAVVVLDQFSRNLFRGTPRAYAADPVARRLARSALARSLDDGMAMQQRLFLYMPFEHSEDGADQALAVRLIAQLGHAEWTRDAIAHKAIIDRFGRFPHRNAILGRSSSADEVALLRNPEQWF